MVLAQNPRAMNPSASLPDFICGKKRNASCLWSPHMCEITSAYSAVSTSARSEGSGLISLKMIHHLLAFLLLSFWAVVEDRLAERAAVTA